MVNKCVIYGCKFGYKSNRNSIPSFHFPLQKLICWQNGLNSSIVLISHPLCANHFIQKFILNGKEKVKLEIKPSTNHVP